MEIVRGRRKGFSCVECQVVAIPGVDGAPKRDAVLDGWNQQEAMDSQEPGRTLKINYSEGEMAEGPRADRTEN